MNAIKISNLKKEFPSVVAVDSISLDIKEGELFGLLGPNGAGKTTTISMLCTLLKPTAGSAKIFSYDIEKDKDNVRSSIGIVFQDPSLDDELTAYENLDFHARLYRIPKELRKKKIPELLELVELKDKANLLVKTFSGGMRRRLEIARGLMHAPKVLFLDEPTLGLDPQSRRKIWEYIERLNKEQKVTILLTTHYMDEADFLCNRIAIIDYGKIVALGTPASLKNKLGGDIVKIEVPENKEKLVKELKASKFCKKVQTENNTITITIKNGERLIPKILDTAKKSRAEVESVSLHKPSLDDVFLHYTGRRIREETSNFADKIKMVRRSRAARRT